LNQIGPQLMYRLEFERLKDANLLDSLRCFRQLIEKRGKVSEHSLSYV